MWDERILSDSKTELAHNLMNRKQNIDLWSAISLYYQTDEMAIEYQGSQQLHSKIGLRHIIGIQILQENVIGILIFYS